MFCNAVGDSDIGFGSIRIVIDLGDNGGFRNRHSRKKVFQVGEQRTAVSGHEIYCVNGIRHHGTVAEFKHEIMETRNRDRETLATRTIGPCEILFGKGHIAVGNENICAFDLGYSLEQAVTKLFRHPISQTIA